MKLNHLTLALGLLVTGLFLGCEKEKNTATGIFSLKVNDTLYTVNKQLTATLHDTAKTGSFLVISGLTAQNNMVTVNVIFPDKQLKPGTYLLSAQNLNSIAWTRHLYSGIYSADDTGKGGTATITLETISETKAKGTFTGVIISDEDPSLKKTVTEGKFEVSVLALK
jgi:hypothetical protein